MFKGVAIGASRHFKKNFWRGWRTSSQPWRACPRTAPPRATRRKPAKAAEKLREGMQQKNPNRRADDGKIVLNGKTYVRKQILAVGGMGMVERFTEEQTGKTVIVKQVKFSDMKEQFVGEAHTLAALRRRLRRGRSAW
jgi:hypothetical protein